MAEKTVKDILEALEEGVHEGFIRGYIAGKLGPKWPIMYKTEPMKVENAYNEAREKYKEYDDTLATGVILSMAWKQYKEIVLKEP